MREKLSTKLARSVLLSLFLLSFWIVFVILPLAEWIFKSLDNLVIKKIGEFFLVFVFGIIPFAIFFLRTTAKLVVSPILEMTATTKILASGNLEKRLPANTNDELSDLSENINKIINNLLSSLQSMIQALRTTKEKEQELADYITRLEAAKSQIQHVADQLQLEKTKLQDANYKNQAILSSIGEAVIATDQHKTIYLFNHIASLITGVEPAQAIGRPYAEVLKIATEKEGERVNLIEEVLNNQPKKSNQRLVVDNAFGQKIPIVESTSLIKNAKSEIQGVVLAFRDMSRERQLDRMKDEFVSVASHELRTPMTAIKGMLSMIIEGDYGEYSEEIKEPLTDIASSADRLIELVNDMLDVSRIEAGRVKIELKKFKIQEIASELTNLLQPIANQKNIELKVGSQSDFTVQADINKVKQVLNNLVSNSLKFTDLGGITITSALDHDLIKVSVTDTGVGITPADQQTLFSKFAQVTSKQAGKPPGTGLGLYISKQLCQMMGGDLWIERSEEGKGSVFTFSLPVSGTTLAAKAAERLSKLVETHSATPA